VRELALHLLDIAQNSVAAQARNITISVIENTSADRLHLAVEDDGFGMNAETIQRVVDPFVTSRTTRSVGLGIPLLKAAAESCEGFLEIKSQVGVGTRVDVEFRRSHIDRMPLEMSARHFSPSSSVAPKFTGDLSINSTRTCSSSMMLKLNKLWKAFPCRNHPC